EVWARENSECDFHGQADVWASQPGIVALFSRAKAINFGKLSSNGPRIPSGYQMKCPMPSDAKSSPEFHEVSPAILPLHSFCQIRFPIRRASPFEIWTGGAALPISARHQKRSQTAMM